MKNELKALYRKDKKLAIKAAKALGYKIEVKAGHISNLTKLFN